MPSNPLTRACAIALGLLAAESAHCQSAAEPASPGAPAQLPQVEVSGPIDRGFRVPNASTATRTDTPLLETPASIQVVPAEVLRDQNAIVLMDALRNVSGVFADQGLITDSYIIRGFTSDVEGYGTVYRDGFRSQVRGRFSLANVEQVEVLKGPAAFLFGRLEPGGLVNIVTKRPLRETRYSLEQQVGEYDLYRTLVDATGAITADGAWAYRVTGEYLRSNSYRDFMFLDRGFIAPSLNWRIDAATELDIDFVAQNESTRQDVGVPPVGDRPAPVPISRWVGDPYDSFGTRTYQTTLTLKHRFDDNWRIEARYIYLYDNGLTNRQIFPAGPFDPATGVLERGYFDFTGVTRNQYATVNLTGEVGLGGTRHGLLVGADYYDWRDTSSGVFTLPGDPGNPPPIDIFDPVYGLPGFDPSLLPAPSDPARTTKRWSGVYLQDQIRIDEQWQALLGWRYDKALYRDDYGSHVSDSAFSQRYALLFKPAAWLALYASYAEGFNAANTGQVLNGTPEPERSNQYELGAKFETADARFGGSIAVYRLTKSNIAQSNPALPPGYVELLGQAQSQGLEIDLSGAVTPALRLIASYAYTNARITADQDDAGGPGLTGKRIHGVPRNAASLWATYDFGAQGAPGLSAGLGIFLVGQRPGDNDNSFMLPGYGRTDAMLSYQWRDGPTRWTAQLNVGNLFDKLYYASGSSFADPGAPRTVVASLRVGF